MLTDCNFIIFKRLIVNINLQLRILVIIISSGSISLW